MSASCAQRIGERAASGAMQGMKQELQQNGGGQYPIETAAGRAAVGAVKALDQPEQQARIREMVAAAAAEAVNAALKSAAGGGEAAAGVDGEQSPIERVSSQAAEAAVAAAVARAVAELGADGDGPLGRSLAGAGRRMGDATAGGALGAVRLPGCAAGQEQACLERLVTQLARATAAGLVSGARDALGWPFLLLAFLAGVIAALLAIWLWSLRHSAPRLLRARPT